MTPQMYIVLGLCALAAIMTALHFLALWMERRGWIYYRRRSAGGGGATAGLLNEFQKIVEPRVEHCIQVMEERNESIGQRLGGRRDEDGDEVATPTARPGRFGDPVLPPNTPKPS